MVCLETTLTYRNDSHDPLEVSFRFPVDEGMAVVGLEAKIAGRTIRGVVSAFLNFNITGKSVFVSAFAQRGGNSLMSPGSFGKP